jgi:hypothetical protein
MYTVYAANKAGATVLLTLLKATATERTWEPEYICGVITESTEKEAYSNR